MGSNDTREQLHAAIQEIAALERQVNELTADLAGLQRTTEGEGQHDHSTDAKVWCETCQREHIAGTPRFTYMCKDCGWGQWYGDQARQHEHWSQENLREVHSTYEVEHVTRPIALMERVKRAEAAVAEVLALYGPYPAMALGQSRWRSADEFLVAIRATLTTYQNGADQP